MTDTTDVPLSQKYLINFLQNSFACLNKMVYFLGELAAQ
jgi:hypothetical protein